MGQLLGGQNNEEKTSGIKNHHYNFVDFGSVYYDGSLYMDGSGPVSYTHLTLPTKA